MSADKGSEPVLDFSQFPPKALHAYIVHHGLGKGYPPVPDRPEADAEEEEEAAVEEEGDEEAGGEAQAELGAGPSTSRAARATVKRRRSRSPADDAVSSKRSKLRARSPTGQPGARRATGAGALAAGENGAATAEEDAEEIEAPAHFADADAAVTHLGAVAARHFQSLPAPKEGEVVVNFLYRCKIGDKTLRVAAN